jgi:hypothetical protein
MSIHGEVFRMSAMKLVPTWVLIGFIGIQMDALALEPRTAPGATVCLLKDSHFQNGAVVYDPTEGAGHRPSGNLRGLGGGNPVWGLSQWNTKSPFIGNPSPDEAAATHVKYIAGSKEITFGVPRTKYADATLRVNSSMEYQTGLRDARERWPGFFLWQRFEGGKPIADLAAVHFEMDAKLSFSRNLHSTGTYDQKKHAAQFSIFLTVQNTNKASTNYGHYVWFGLPVYDNRHEMSPHHEQKDTFTEKFIYLVGAENKSSISTATSKGFLQEPVSLSDFYVKSIHVGWEVPGTFDVEFQVRDLNVCVE